MSDAAMTREAALELVLLAGAIKSSQAKSAKDVLPERSLYPVDVSLRIRGTVSKGVATPAADTESPVRLDPWTRSVVGEFIRRCKIDSRTWKRAMRAALKADPEKLVRGNAELIEGVEAIANELAAERPPIKYRTNGRAATVRVEGVEIEHLDPMRKAA